VEDQRVESALLRELRCVTTDELVVVNVRVTATAVAGSIVALGLHPERVRALGLTKGQAVRAVEVLMHPTDWFLLAAQSARLITIGPRSVWRIDGVPVVDDDGCSPPRRV
jgi:hypothetical protein